MWCRRRSRFDQSPDAAQLNEALPPPPQQQASPPDEPVEEEVCIVLRFNASEMLAHPRHAPRVQTLAN